MRLRSLLILSGSSPYFYIMHFLTTLLMLRSFIRSDCRNPKIASLSRWKSILDIGKISRSGRSKVRHPINLNILSVSQFYFWDLKNYIFSLRSGIILTPDTFYILRICIFLVTGLNLKQTCDILLCIFESVGGCSALEREPRSCNCGLRTVWSTQQTWPCSNQPCTSK